MNKETWSILGAVVAVVILAILITVTGCEKKVPLEVGQVWEWEWGTDDPFDTEHIALRKILALKDGYVQYERMDDLAKGVVSSMEERIFRAGGAKLMEAEPIVMEFDDIGKNDLVPLIHTTVAMIEYPVLETEPNIPVWGNGDLPAEFQAFFGDTNGARLDFMQNRVIDRHDQIIREIAKRILILDGADPNEVEAVEKLGRINE